MTDITSTRRGRLLLAAFLSGAVIGPLAHNLHHDFDHRHRAAGGSPFEDAHDHHDDPDHEHPDPASGAPADAGHGEGSLVHLDLALLCAPPPLPVPRPAPAEIVEPPAPLRAGSAGLCQARRPRGPPSTPLA